MVAEEIKAFSFQKIEKAIVANLDTPHGLHDSYQGFDTQAAHAIITVQRGAETGCHCRSDRPWNEPCTATGRLATVAVDGLPPGLELAQHELNRPHRPS
jgi:hypothetical protein